MVEIRKFCKKYYKLVNTCLNCLILFKNWCIFFYEYFCRKFMICQNIFFHEIVENCEAHCIEFHGALDIVNFMYMYLDIYCNKCCNINIYDEKYVLQNFIYLTHNLLYTMLFHVDIKMEPFRREDDDSFLQD